VVWRQRVFVGERRVSQLPAHAVGFFWFLVDGSETALERGELFRRLASAGVRFQASPPTR
jgi:hypothetical protein